MLNLYAFIYFQMLHACSVSDPQNGAFQNIWKEHLSKICVRPVIDCPDSVWGHSEAPSTGVGNPNQCKADMIFALSSLNK